jgi:hypothetical protein
MCDSLGQSAQKVKVWQLKMLGQSIIFDSHDDLIEAVRLDTIESDDENEIVITPKWMYKHEIENLPEFEGY